MTLKSIYQINTNKIKVNNMYNFVNNASNCLKNFSSKEICMKEIESILNNRLIILMKILMT